MKASSTKGCSPMSVLSVLVSVADTDDPLGSIRSQSVSVSQ